MKIMDEVLSHFEDGAIIVGTLVEPKEYDDEEKDILFRCACVILCNMDNYVIEKFLVTSGSDDETSEACCDDAKEFLHTLVTHEVNFDNVIIVGKYEDEEIWVRVDFHGGAFDVLFQREKRSAAENLLAQMYATLSPSAEVTRVDLDGMRSNNTMPGDTARCDGMQGIIDACLDMADAGIITTMDFSPVGPMTDADKDGTFLHVAEMLATADGFTPVQMALEMHDNSILFSDVKGYVAELVASAEVPNCCLIMGEYCGERLALIFTREDFRLTVFCSTSGNDTVMGLLQKLFNIDNTATSTFRPYTPSIVPPS